MRSKIIITVVLSVFVLFSCKDEPITIGNDLVVKALNQKIESFKENKRKECYETIFSDAEILVDSIIAEQLNLDTVQPKYKELELEIIKSAKSFSQITKIFQLVEAVKFDIVIKSQIENFLYIILLFENYQKPFFSFVLQNACTFDIHIKIFDHFS